MWNQCVLDASMGGPPFAFCPIEGDITGDFVVVAGINYVGLPPEGTRVVAIVHPDGDDAVNAFCEKHSVALDTLSKTLKRLEPELYV